MPQAETSQVQPPQRAFVGREREMAELCAGLEVPASDRRRVLLISGEAGIGKTRLAEEFASYAASRGTRIVWGRCWEGGGIKERVDRQEEKMSGAVGTAKIRSSGFQKVSAGSGRRRTL
jgi:predicted ATP-dependent serine protease